MITKDRVILLVEDSHEDALLATRAFTKSAVEHTIVVAGDGEEALHYLFASGPHATRDATAAPRLVLLDLKLPGIDGLEVLRRMRAEPQTRLLPVVILTSSREPQDVAASYDLGANSYVRKPVDFTQFVEEARQIGQYWLVLNEPPPSGEGRP